MSGLRRQNGFIMAEVVVGMMLTSIVLLAVTGMFLQSTKAANGAAEYTAAANLAQKQLELLKLRSDTYWKNLALPASIAWQGTAAATGPYSVATTAFVSIDDSRLVEVVVVVSWTRQGQARQVQLTTFYSCIP
ncbi:MULTISPECIES: hypothetical protein [Sporomusa]|uniref:type IV pilus modification PilV family protein n=1 Tax=Sporomusa TaxID=2375 RepID=UPI0031591A52